MNHGIKYFIINNLMMIDVARKDQSRDLISAVEGVRSLKNITIMLKKYKKKKVC